MEMLAVYLSLPRHMRDILLRVSTVELPSIILILTLREVVGMIITLMQARDTLILILPILIIRLILKKSSLILS